MADPGWFIRLKPVILFGDAHASHAGFGNWWDQVEAVFISSDAPLILLEVVPDEHKDRDFYLQKIGHAYLVLCFASVDLTDLTARTILRDAKDLPRPAFAAYQALRAHYQPATPMAAAGAYLTFGSYVYDTGISLTKNATIFDNCVRHAQSFGTDYKLPEGYLNIHFLSRLPADMQPLVPQLLNKAPSITFTRLLAEVQELASYKDHQASVQETATAFSARRVDSTGSGAKAIKGGTSGAGGSGPGTLKPCRNCLSTAHVYTDCPKASTKCPDCRLHRGVHHPKCATGQAAAPAPTGRDGNLAQGFAAEPAALMARGGVEESVINSTFIYSGSSQHTHAMLGAQSGTSTPLLPPGVTNFIYDSGASDHITPDRGDFQAYEPLDPNTHRLKVGGGFLGIHGAGSVLCTTLQMDGPPSNIILRRVLHVPSWGDSKILSAPAIKAAGVPMVGDYEALLLRDGTRLPIHSTPYGFHVQLRVLPPTAGQSTDPRPPMPACALLAQPRFSASDTKLLLHTQLGHMGVPTMNRLISADFFPKLGISASTVMTTCESCELSKVSTQPPSATHGTPILGPAPLPGWRIHADFKDLSRTPDITIGAKWMFILTDAATGTTWIMGMRHRSELLPYLKQWHKDVLEHTDLKLTNLHSDNMKELTDAVEVRGWLRTIGAHLTTSSPYTSNENGEAESAINAITTRVQATLLYCGLPMSFWLLAAQDLLFKRNRLPPAKAITLKSGFERWTRRAPDISIFRAFGAPAYYRLPAARVSKSKLDIRGHKGLFVGYDTRSVAFKIWAFDSEVSKGRVIITRNAVINEAWRMVPTAAPLPVDDSRPDINDHDHLLETSTISTIAAPPGPLPRPSAGVRAPPWPVHEQDPNFFHLVQGPRSKTWEGRGPGS